MATLAVFMDKVGDSSIRRVAQLQRLGAGMPASGFWFRARYVAS